MSYFMDYGEDWPPSPERPKEPRPRMSLAERCAWTVLTYALIAVAGLLALHIRQHPAPFDPYGHPVTYATTRIGPPPRPAP